MFLDIATGYRAFCHGPEYSLPPVVFPYMNDPIDTVLNFALSYFLLGLAGQVVSELQVKAAVRSAAPDPK